ncbi:MAG TPA: endonuclease/exonuclease/phosphatase family protein [Thermomicrobiales bacterium]|nr:endonuclease/exonuclease/phosphatase family protein [Thermomicrobiales bacterium]
MGPILKVLTYNIHHAEGMKRDAPEFAGNADLEQIARIIRASGADIVALQEVDRGNPRSGGADQPAELSRILDMYACFGCNISISGGGEYGVATFSRFPIRSHENLPLPGGNGLEPRGVLKSIVEIPEVGDVTVLNTHFQFATGDNEAIARTERHRQALVVLRMIEECPGPIILMGDFNAEPDDPELHPLLGLTDAWRIAGDGSAGRTIPGHPMLESEARIDMIFVNERFQVHAATVLATGEARYGSDHLPVLAELSIQ